MSYPNDRKYSETHEWFQTEGDTVTVGITQYAADELTDITYVELPEVGTKVAAGEALCEVESVKATSEVLSTISGTITEVNTALVDSPELVNDDPLGKAWIVRLKADSLEPLDGLLDAPAYDKSIA